jgi:hypothetical protein
MRPKSAIFRPPMVNKNRKLDVDRESYGPSSSVPTSFAAAEGTSEASLAASAPREAQMLYQPEEPGPGPGRTHGGLRGWNRDGGSNDRLAKAHERHYRGWTVVRTSEATRNV